MIDREKSIKLKHKRKIERHNQSQTHFILHYRLSDPIIFRPNITFLFHSLPKPWFNRFNQWNAEQIFLVRDRMREKSTLWGFICCNEIRKLNFILQLPFQTESIILTMSIKLYNYTEPSVVVCVWKSTQFHRKVFNFHLGLHP